MKLKSLVSLIINCLFLLTVGFIITIGKHYIAPPAPLEQRVLVCIAGSSGEIGACATLEDLADEKVTSP